jgi:hypothetical protein
MTIAPATNALPGTTEFGVSEPMTVGMIGFVLPWMLTAPGETTTPESGIADWGVVVAETTTVVGARFVGIIGFVLP